MKKNLILIFSVLILTITACNKEDTATIIIDLKSSELAKTGETTGFFDRLVNILTFSRKANAATPSNITSYQINITSPDMETITAEYPADITSIVIKVPAGNKTIALTANIDPSDARAVLAYTGSATVDLEAGETKNVTLTMMASETKLLIPDYYTSRIIQIDDMNGTNWKTLVKSQITGGVTLATFIYLYDIAFDAQGRIYVANNTSTASNTTIFRIDSIPSSGSINATEIVNANNVPNVYWLAIDRKNSILYFTTSSVLYSSALDGTSRTARITLTGSNFYGINVDDDGNVYIARSNLATINIVDKYNHLNFATPVATFNFSAHYGVNAYFPRDVVVKSGNIFVAVDGSDLAARKIVQLNSNLEFIDDYGSGANDTAPGQFYGPCHFVAKLNRKLYIMDDGDLVVPYFSLKDKLVSMDDIKGTNWTIYGSNGSDIGQFSFYYNC